MHGEIPLWVKIAYTALVAVIVPVYLAYYGPANFLWFSDIALILTAVALWCESRLLASMMAVGLLLPELIWNLSFFGGLLFGMRITGLADYMFQSDKPRFLRALSLFHVVLPVVLVWMLDQLGYDRRALLAQTVLAWGVLPLTYCCTDRSKNINWVFGPGKPQTVLPRLLFLLLLMVLFPLCVYLPTHLVLACVFPAG